MTEILKNNIINTQTISITIMLSIVVITMYYVFFKKYKRGTLIILKKDNGLDIKISGEDYGFFLFNFKEKTIEDLIEYLKMNIFKTKLNKYILKVHFENFEPNERKELRKYESYFLDL